MDEAREGLSAISLPAPPLLRSSSRNPKLKGDEEDEEKIERGMLKWGEATGNSLLLKWCLYTHKECVLMSTSYTAFGLPFGTSLSLGERRVFPFNLIFLFFYFFIYEENERV